MNVSRLFLVFLFLTISGFTAGIEYATLKSISDGDTFVFKGSASGEFICFLGRFATAK